MSQLNGKIMTVGRNWLSILSLCVTLERVLNAVIYRTM